MEGVAEAMASATSRVLFYPSILYNLTRSRLQEDWCWHTEITDSVILGALPFPSMLPVLQELGVTAVVTLNQEFELFLTTHHYGEASIDHLWLPTIDYLYAPPLKDLHSGCDFIAQHARAGGRVYVHCKAGRGRSATLLLCYLVREEGMDPEQAYTLVKSKRPQISLAKRQWEAVEEFYHSCCLWPSPRSSMSGGLPAAEIGVEAAAAAAEGSEQDAAATGAAAGTDASVTGAQEQQREQQFGEEKQQDQQEQQPRLDKTAGGWAAWLWRSLPAVTAPDWEPADWPEAGPDKVGRVVEAAQQAEEEHRLAEDGQLEGVEQQQQLGKNQQQEGTGRQQQQQRRRQQEEEGTQRQREGAEQELEDAQHQQEGAEEQESTLERGNGDAFFGGQQPEEEHIAQQPWWSWKR